MEFISPRNKTPSVKRIHRGSALVKTEYVNSLQLYLNPPTEIVTLQEFDEFAVERLKVLRTIERINLGKHIKYSDAWRQALKTDLDNQNLKSYYRLSTTSTNERDQEAAYEARRKDHISHFVLRLAFCKTEELRRWFVSQETDLFRLRYAEETLQSIRNFFEAHQLNYVPITDAEKSRLEEKIISSIYGLNSAKLQGTDIFKIVFTDALDLVKSRKVYLENGYAFVPADDLVSIVTALFRSQLSLAMTMTARSVPQLEDDERLMQLLSDFDKRYTGQDFGNTKQMNANGAITPDMLDGLSKTSYPLCMRHLHENLRANHHLKHGGRMQYGLFIKGIGMSLENSLKFWRDEFTKTMDVDKFEKQHSYNVRHNYGKEGKHTSYSPYSCIKIINSSVGPGDSHGCPFKHFDPALLRQKLLSYRVATNVVGEIVDLASRHHYQIACQRYFEATHNAEPEGGIQHPNQYFLESQKVLNSSGESKPKVKLEKIETIHATAYIASPAESEGKATNGGGDMDWDADDAALATADIDP